MKLNMPLKMPDNKRWNIIVLTNFLRIYGLLGLMLANYAVFAANSTEVNDLKGGSGVEITNPTYFCVHKEKTNAILKIISTYANAFVNENIDDLKNFFSPDCQEVIKSQTKIFKGRDEVINHIKDVLGKANKNHYKITNFEIKDPCTIFQGNQAVVTFFGIETYSGKSPYKLAAHITAILSKENDKQELSLKSPVIPLKITATFSKEGSKAEANPPNFSDYKCILFQMDGWKPYHPKH